MAEYYIQRADCNLKLQNIDDVISDYKSASLAAANSTPYQVLLCKTLFKYARIEEAKTGIYVHFSLLIYFTYFITITVMNSCENFAILKIQNMKIKNCFHHEFCSLSNHRNQFFKSSDTGLVPICRS